MERTNPAAGIFSVCGTYVLITFLAFKFGGIRILTQELPALFTGRLYEIAKDNASLLMVISVIFASIAMELPLTIGIGLFHRAILGGTDENKVSDVLSNMKEGNHFFTFFLLVLIEEVIARWFFLGFLRKIPILSGTMGFYALVIIGNGIWALIHLSNYKRKKDKHVLRVLPQFVAGFFFTYIFMKYGLLATILNHFASNAVLFALHKVQKINASDVFVTIYAAICGIVSYGYMQKPLADVISWFTNHPVFVLHGWMFWDYVRASIFFSSCSVVIFGCLLYDRNESMKEESENEETGFSESILFLPASVGILYAVYALLGAFITNVPYRILTLAILFAFTQKNRSGSGTSRTFWSALPGLFMAVCIMQALGFWLSIGWLFIETLVDIPNQLFAHFKE